MPRLRLFTVDAFSDKLFSGNPAGVCPLEAWLPDATLQAIAAENNLAETAFFVREQDGWRIRWFSPQKEIDLCGHATLASAHVLINHLGARESRFRFQSPLSGALAVERTDGRYVLDFPTRDPQPAAAPAALVQGLGARPLEVLRGRDYFAVFAHEKDVRALRPDFKALAELEALGIIATAPGSGDGVDFVSRFFAPRAGIDEDPATGSSHCALIPYWAKRLGKTKLRARQLSARGGEFFCELAGDRVKIGGHAVTYLVGEINV